MKLRWLMIVLFLFSQLTATYSSRRQRRSLSPVAKKPAPSAGFRYLTLCISHLTALFLLAASLSPTTCSPNLFIQTPSSC